MTSLNPLQCPFLHEKAKAAHLQTPSPLPPLPPPPPRSRLALPCWPRHVLEMLACEQANPWAWAPMFAKEVSLLNLSVGFNWYCFLYNQAGQLN